MPTLISKPARIESVANLPIVIDEYIGRVNSNHGRVSIAILSCPPGWIEPGQTPEFEEFTIVLKGMLRIAHRAGILDIPAGQGIITHPGEWVQYSTPGAEGAEYLAVCLPAFDLDMAHRDL
jgi:hypothetical protein